MRINIFQICKSFKKENEKCYREEIKKIRALAKNEIWDSKEGLKICEPRAEAYKRKISGSRKCAYRYKERIEHHKKLIEELKSGEIKETIDLLKKRRVKISKWIESYEELIWDYKNRMKDDEYFKKWGNYKRRIEESGGWVQYNKKEIKNCKERIKKYKGLKKDQKYLIQDIKAGDTREMIGILEGWIRYNEGKIKETQEEIKSCEDKVEASLKNIEEYTRKLEFYKNLLNYISSLSRRALSPSKIHKNLLDYMDSLKNNL